MERGILLQCAAIPAALPAAERWLALLPPPTAGTARSRRTRTATATGLALLASCARAAPAVPPLLRLAREASGRPYWPGGPGFSIAHAAGHAVCALATASCAVGVDLEAERATDLERLRLVTSVAERRAVQAGELSAAALWTCKEAVLKAAGAVLAEAPAVEIDGRLGHHAGRTWHLWRMEPVPGLQLALATSIPVAPPRVVWTDVTTLSASIP